MKLIRQYNRVFKRLIFEEKKGNLSKDHKNAPIPNAPGWKSETATNSEESVKADRNDDHSMEDMKKKSIKSIHEKHHK